MPEPENDILNDSVDNDAEINSSTNTGLNAPHFQLQLKSLQNSPYQLKKEGDEQTSETSKESPISLDFDNPADNPTDPSDNPLGTASPPPFQLKSASSSAMPGETLSQMSSTFGTDFSDVNIHQGSQSAVDAGALAYTQGNDIHFAPGQYDPASQSGQELLGHELTHVVQQREGRVQANNEVNGMPLNDDKGLEKEADDMGTAVAQKKTATTQNTSMYVSNQPSTFGTMQRWKLPWESDPPAKDGKDSKDDKKLKKVTKGGKSIAPNFDANISTPEPLPAMGKMEVITKIDVDFQDCNAQTIDKLAIYDSPADKKVWAKQIKEIAKKDPASLKWSDADKAKFKTDYQKSVSDVWSSDASKLSFKLDHPDYEKYMVNNTIKMEFTDKDPHHKISTIKMLPNMQRLRSNMALFDSRDVSEKEKRKVTKNYLAEQIGDFDKGKSDANATVKSRIEAFNDKSIAIQKQHATDTPAPNWNVELRGRSSSGGSKSLNSKLSKQRVNTVEAGILGKIPGVSVSKTFTGDTNSEADSKFQRVEAIFMDANLIDIEQNVAAHETGHMFGFGDEYEDETTTGALKKSTGDEANDPNFNTSKAVRDAGMGEDVVKEHRINQNLGSIMHSGSQVGVGHYSLFLIELKKLSTDAETGGQVDWKVSK